MSLVASVVDGVIQETASASSLSKTQSSSGSSMDKEAFLQLLVAQMRYQDPLEPTSNTEFISQYAQFSQVEQLQNVASSMDLQRASQLVGQYVRMKTVNSSGDTNYVEGKVDYVSYESGKAYLAIEGELYSMDDLDTVADTEYLEAVEIATQWVVDINKLPSVANVSMDEADEIDRLKAAYDDMSDYQKTFIASEKVSDLNSYVERIAEVRRIAEALEAAEETAETDDAADETDSAEATE